MPSITIPKKLTKGEELVVVPLKEYEEYSRWRATIREFVPTPAQKRDLRRARRDYKSGKYLTLHELKRKLANQNKR